MTYEFCLFETAAVRTHDAAYALWDKEAYRAASQPDFERDAPKWRMKDALLKANPALLFREPVGKPGVLDKLLDDDEPANYLVLVDWTKHSGTANDDDADEQATHFHLFDQAIEVTLPWNPPEAAVRKIVRDAWQNLRVLSSAGFGTILDTERNILLNLETDLEFVEQRYRENICYDGEGEPPGANAIRAAPQSSAPSAVIEPFNGNLPAGKPWWKIW